MKNKTVIIIAGPTAVGKTGVGIAVAKHFGTEIISADSRQCFRELNIGVARPLPEELAEVMHHFIASHSIHQKITAATFEEYALEKVSKIFQRNKVAVMVGGTGLYIKAFTEGMDKIPDVPQQLHDEVVSAYNQFGLEWLRSEVQRMDPWFFSEGEAQNPQRLMRALEVVRCTGKSILTFQTGAKKQREFDTVKFALQLPKEELHKRINQRVETMMEKGLPEEVRSLMPYRHLNALQTVGYKELFAYFDGEVALNEAKERIKSNTRQYAKRQLTWFKKEKDFSWVQPDAEKLLRMLP